MSLTTLEAQLQELKTTDVTSREYQVLLAKINTMSKSMLGETSNKVYPLDKDVEATVIEALIDCKNPEVEMQDYFKEYDEFLDSPVYKYVIQTQVKLHFKEYCSKAYMSFVYTKMLSRVNTLRKLRTALELFQYILNLQSVIGELQVDLKEASKYPSKLLSENSRLRTEIDNIYSVYTSDDEDIDRYFKYKKLKADGCSDQEIAKVLEISRPTLSKIVKGFESVN